MSNAKLTEWVLRIATAGTFLGHGTFALQVKEGWIPYFISVGISPDTAVVLLPLIGMLDVTLAILVLVKPVRAALLWMAIWGFWTALLRPIAGEPIWDLVERSANWGAPLALLLLMGWPTNIKGWFR